MKLFITENRIHAITVQIQTIEVYNRFGWKNLFMSLFSLKTKCSQMQKYIMNIRVVTLYKMSERYTIKLFL